MERGANCGLALSVMFLKPKITLEVSPKSTNVSFPAQGITAGELIGGEIQDFTAKVWKMIKSQSKIKINSQLGMLIPK